MRIIHVLPHSMEPYVPELAAPDAWTSFSHHLPRFIRMLRTCAPEHTHELWCLTARHRVPQSWTHDLGMLVRAFPRDLPVPLPLETSRSLFQAARAEARNHPPDLWHLHGYYLWMYDYLALSLARARQAVVAHHRGGRPTFRALPYSVLHYGFTLPVTLRLARHIFVQNQRESRRLHTWYRLPSSRLTWTPNAVRIPPPRPPRAPGPLRLVTVGRVISYKGVREILCESRRLRHRGLSHTLDIIGTGSAEAELRREFPEPEVRFRGHLSEEAISDHLMNADVFVFGTQRGEGSPHALIAAQAHGVPAVAFACEGVEEAVADGVTGSLVRSWDAFGQAIERLADNGLRARFGAAARARSAALFADTIIAPRILSVYAQACRLN